MHVVGEQYRHREEGSRALIPPQMLTADTLEELAAIYQRPIEEFLRHNQERGWAPDQPLPAGTSVNVPDPAFRRWSRRGCRRPFSPVGRPVRSCPRSCDTSSR